MIKIFVSHTWADKVKPQFGQLYEELKGYDLWIDKTELRPGVKIRDYLKSAINDTEIVLVLWSENALASPDMLFEIETAAALQKPILPCIIDDHPLRDSPYLDGMLYVDLRERNENEYPVLGWMKIRHFLSAFFIDKFSRKIMDYDEDKKQQALPMLESIKQSQETLKHQISLLEDSMHRRNLDAKGRNRNNPYSVNMMNTIVTDLRKEHSSLHDNQVADFIEFSRSLFSQYPDDDQLTVKKRNELMLEKITEIDPQEENEKLAFFKTGLNMI